LGFYDRFLLSRAIDRAMRLERLEPYRRRTVARARGRVLEVGAGSGLNTRFYPDAVTRILALEPHPGLRRRMFPDSRVAPVGGTAEALPLRPASIDTIVSTWTLCSIAGLEAALEEMRRVLRPDGELLFVEHGLAPDPGLARWQRRLSPLWRQLAGGCHLDREAPRWLEATGFELTELRAAYMPGPRLLTYMYEGVARRRS
jgi:ubiquinone/menaquinone biosynthesis C-methylase UbiE